MTTNANTNLRLARLASCLISGLLLDCVDVEGYKLKGHFNVPPPPVSTGGNSALGSGGARSSGGAPAMGGSHNGGSFPGGGTKATGGSKATGGTLPLGGSHSAGGGLQIGGATLVGGSKATGGMTFTGGSPVIGGSRATGGMTFTGGSPATGGFKATGGAYFTGATPATGGWQATGGTTSADATQAIGGTTGTGGSGGTHTGGSTSTKLAAVSIAAGMQRTCAVLSDGTVRCWGYNGGGLLGIGSNTGTNPTPVAVAGISNAIAIDTGNGDTVCALLGAGTVKCWGSNDSGQLGNGTTTKSTVPVTVSGISGAVGVSVGNDHSCAILTPGGDVMCWGGNGNSELGSSSTLIVPMPVSVWYEAMATSAGGSHNCAVLLDHTIECRGLNAYGQLGTGTAADGNDYGVVSGINNAIAVSAGYAHTCALLVGGEVKCWGQNSGGELGNGSTANCPAPVVTGISDAVALSMGNGFSCAVLTGGTVECWGHDSTGQLGTGSIPTDYCHCSQVPVQVTGISTAIAVSSGSSHTCAILGDGTLQCWGDNSTGQLGDGTTTSSSVPVTVSGF